MSEEFIALRMAAAAACLRLVALYGGEPRVLPPSS